MGVVRKHAVRNFYLSSLRRRARAQVALGGGQQARLLLRDLSRIAQLRKRLGER